MSQSHQVCVVVALEAYSDLTAEPSVYLYDAPVYPFKHVFMSQVVDKHRCPRRDKCFPRRTRCIRSLDAYPSWIASASISGSREVRFAWLQHRSWYADQRGAQHGTVEQLVSLQQVLQLVSTQFRSSFSRPHFVA